MKVMVSSHKNGKFLNTKSTLKRCYKCTYDYLKNDKRILKYVFKILKTFTEGTSKDYHIPSLKHYHDLFQ